MKKIFPVLFFLFLVLPVSVLEAAELIDRIVAVVNDEVVTQSELDRQLAPIYQSYKEQYQGSEFFSQMNKARTQILNQMIEDKLVLQDAKKKKIEVSDGEVDGKLAEVRSRFRSEEDFKRFMDSQGMTLNKLKERYRDTIMIQKVQYVAVRMQVVVSPTEARKYYDEHQAEFKSPEALEVRSLTIRKKPGEPPQNAKNSPGKEKAEGLRRRIVQGQAKFEEIADQFSEDTHAKEGGDMGKIHRGELAPQFEDAVFKLDEGQVTPVLESEIGFHIFKLDKKEPEKVIPYEEAKRGTEGRIYQEKAKKKFNEWIERLKQDAYIAVK